MTGGPQDHSHVQKFTGTQRTQHRGAVSTKIYLSNAVNVHVQISRRKDTRESRGTYVWASLCSPPHKESHSPPFLQVEKPIRDLAAKAFTGGLITQTPLPSPHQNSTLPEGNQVCCINHTGCTKSLGTVNHPNQVGGEGNTPQL